MTIPPNKPRVNRAGKSPKSRKPFDWDELLRRADIAGIPINKAILVRGRTLRVDECVVCGGTHSHGWAGEWIGSPPSHRSAHCRLPGALSRGYYLELVDGDPHETAARGVWGCIWLEMQWLEDMVRPKEKAK